MKQTGLTRKIDELGRIVIPKEIRKNLVIKDGENLEIYTNDDSIILKKYSKMASFEKDSIKLSNIFKEILDVDIYLTDRENYIYPDSIKNIKIDNFFHILIDNRKSYSNQSIPTLKNIELKKEYIILPIINDSLCIGLVIFTSDKELELHKLAKLYIKILLEKINIY